MRTNRILNNTAFLVIAFLSLLLISQAAAAQSGNGRTTPPRKTTGASKPNVQKSTNSAIKTNRSTPGSRKTKHRQENVAVSNTKPRPAPKTARKKEAQKETEVIADERTAIAIDEIKTAAEPQKFFPIQGMLPTLNSSASPADEIELPKRELEAKEDRSKKPMPIVRIQQVSIEPNVFEDGIKGVAISVKFKISKQAGAAAKIVANFYPEKNAVSYNNVSQTSENNFDQLFVEEVFTPATEESYYSNFSLFMPYEKLEQAYQSLSEKPLKIKMQIQIRELDESILASSNYTRLIVQ